MTEKNTSRLRDNSSSGADHWLRDSGTHYRELAECLREIARKCRPKSAAGTAGAREAVRAQSGAVSTPDAESPPAGRQFSAGILARRSDQYSAQSDTGLWTSPASGRERGDSRLRCLTAHLLNDFPSPELFFRRTANIARQNGKGQSKQNEREARPQVSRERDAFPQKQRFSANKTDLLDRAGKTMPSAQSPMPSWKCRIIERWLMSGKALVRLTEPEARR